MEKLKVAVIGTGHLGKLHAKLFKQVEQAELIGIYDQDQNKAQELAKELECKSFDSIEQLIDSVDALNIVTPTTTHHEIAKMALNKKKHIFIEKPITKTEKEAQDLIRLAKEQNCIIQVGHIERFNASMLALEDVAINPVFVEAHRLASFNPRGTDVAVILDLMIHDLDLILHLVKSKPVKVDASGVGVVSTNVDIANARIEFENGCVANVTASRISAKKMRKMRIFQRNAYISLDFTDGFSEIFYLPEPGQASFKDSAMAFSLGQIDQGDQKRDINYTKLQRKDVNPLLNELASFVDSVQNNKPVAVSAEDGLEALKLANAVLEKIAQHQKKLQ
ncbi:MAG: gfo/Idh/MocA family oxidoreductase [Calditrichaeota bacterium]|nr:MAG: gfo/Idh/MocA family oxidoreductase [Calditrichota bacterium]MBL1206307.1 gfo/Idh/MocA family oxidoreductase [Calditrichota bacterium]NOG46133.1 Gfo/Idh/MocA family oxidoreductase [Calditrichota bacterium]